MAEGLSVLFFPEAAYGPTNNCIGIGDVLHKMGHRVVFAAESSYEGTLEPLGFEEQLVRLNPPPETEEEPGQFWKDFIRDTSPEFRKPTINQLESFIKPTWQALLDTSHYVESQLQEVIERVKPDVIVEDNVLCFPAITTAGVPWVRILSCNPLELKDPNLAPVFSGYPESDRTGWAEFVSEYQRVHNDMWADFNQWCLHQGTDPLPELEFIHESPWLNLYLYPALIDYRRARTLAPTWHRLETSVRTTDQPFSIPRELGTEGSLVYLSLGSLGSADLELMKRLVAVLAETPHRYIVSKGPQADLYELAPNMWGEQFTPQTSILPQVDLIITHGGNNTTTEGFHFGKPMIALPLFWDQYDNAQRLDETGFGVRLSTYEFEPEQLQGAIDRLVGDLGLRDKMAVEAKRLQSQPGTAKAAGLIETLGRSKAPVLV